MEIEEWLDFIHKEEQPLYREVIQNASKEMSGSFDYRMNTALGGECHSTVGLCTAGIREQMEEF